MTSGAEFGDHRPHAGLFPRQGLQQIQRLLDTISEQQVSRCISESSWGVKKNTHIQGPSPGILISLADGCSSGMETFLKSPGDSNARQCLRTTALEPVSHDLSLALISQAV